MIFLVWDSTFCFISSGRFASSQAIASTLFQPCLNSRWSIVQMENIGALHFSISIERVACILKARVEGDFKSEAEAKQVTFRDHSFLMTDVLVEWNVYGYEIFFDKFVWV